MPPIERRYRILDTDVRILSEREDWVAPFHLDYGHFEVGDSKEPAEHNLRLTLTANPRGGPDIARNGMIVASLTPPYEKLAYGTMKRLLYRNLTGFLFFHAAVAAKDGRALILSGPARSGKTTLLLRLLGAGFEFFSDEICPLALGSGLVHPFPRTAWVADSTAGPGKKKPCPPAGLGAPVGRNPARPAVLFLLDDGRGDPPPMPLTIIIRTDRLEPFLAEAGLVSPRIAAVPGFPYSEVMVSYPGERDANAALIQALGLYGDDIIRADFPAAARFDFSRSPAAETIPAAEAARLWLGRLLDRAQPGLMERPGQELFRLARTLEETFCLRLVPGDLGRTAALVLAAWNEGERS